MRIRVEDIPPQGMTVRADRSTSWAVTAATEALDAAPTELSVSVRASPGSVAGHARVVLSLKTRCEALCDRCGEPVGRSVAVDTELLYQPESSEGSDEEIELGEDELDVGWYRDGHLSLHDIVMEAVALELPSRILCVDTASCNDRTQNMLAEASKGAVGHPAFAALKNLKN